MVFSLALLALIYFVKSFYHKMFTKQFTPAQNRINGSQLYIL